MLLSDGAGAAFEFFSAVKQKCQIYDYSSTRTPEQKNMTHIVRTQADWQTIKQLVTQEVLQHRFLTFDTESFIGRREDNWAEKDKLLYVLVGTLVGRAIVFDVLALHNGRSACDGDTLMALPGEIFDWLQSNKVVVVGSNIKKDCEKLQLEANKLVDTAYTFAKAMTPVGDQGALVRIGDTAKTGFGIQAFFSKGMDYKPMKVKTFVNNYGRHQYRPKWPAWRDPTVLYKWNYGEAKLLEEHHLFYMYHDSTCGASLVAALAVEHFVQGRYNPVGDVTPADVMEVILGQDFASADVDLVITVSQQEVPPVDMNVSNNRSLANAAAQTDEPEIEIVSLVGMPTTRPLPGTSFAFFTHHDERMNPYRKQPAFPRLCYACGQSKHSLNDYKGNLMCPMRLNPTATLRCRYTRCRERDNHVTRVCKRLHSRCSRCRHRGHESTTDCGKWTETDWEEDREAWEAVADSGYWTSKRRGHCAWGYFSHVWGTAYPHRLTYAEMRRLKVSTVDRLLYGDGRGEQERETGNKRRKSGGKGQGAKRTKKD